MVKICAKRCPIHMQKPKTHTFVFKMFQNLIHKGNASICKKAQKL